MLLCGEQGASWQWGQPLLSSTPRTPAHPSAGTASGKFSVNEDKPLLNLWCNLSYEQFTEKLENAKNVFVSSHLNRILTQEQLACLESGDIGGSV